MIKRLINVLLAIGEQKLACWFTAYYEINIDDSDIKNAIKKEQYEWLNYVWAFNKNWIEEEEGKAPVFVKMDKLFGWIGDKYSTMVEEGTIDTNLNIMEEKARER